MPFAFFHFGIKAKLMRRVEAPIRGHGVLQRLIVWEIMSKGIGEIVERVVHSQEWRLVNFFQILALQAILDFPGLDFFDFLI